MDQEKAKPGRINSKITMGYQAVNDEGETTIDFPTTVITIKDQSPEAASFHLMSIVNGVCAPAVKQAETIKG